MPSPEAWLLAHEAELVAIKAEIEAIKAANAYKQQTGIATPYDDVELLEKAEEARHFAERLLRKE
jgi:hypothetical protein